MKKFNQNFIFSTSTCAFQIEGGRELGGRKKSIWDDFTIKNFFIPKKNEPKREINSIKIASNFYKKYLNDIEIMSKLGVNGFVYNMDWARIMPDDSGIPNEKGLKFYENLFKNLKRKKIQPIPILYHWDTPIWLEKKGGASSRIFVKEFQNFAKIVFKRLGKYSNTWFTNDENSTFTTLSYLDSYNPPQKKNPKEFWKAVHFLNLSSAMAKKEFENAKKNGFVSKNAILGIDHDWNPAIPYDLNDVDDLKSCKIFNKYNLNLWLDPNLKGEYPKLFFKEIEKMNLNKIVKKKDLKLLKKYTLDLIGWNYYRPAIIASPKRLNEKIDWFNKPINFITKEAYIVFPKNQNYTDWKWLIKPENLFHGSKILKKRYNNKPIMIIENGIGNFDKKINGIVNDDFRINFLNEHIKMVQKALNEGINFIGYSLWTFIDIFSPSGGYRKKYGIVGVDFDDKNLKRYPKSSFFWYKNLIKNKNADWNKINYKKFKDEALNSLKEKIWK